MKNSSLFCCIELFLIGVFHWTLSAQTFVVNNVLINGANDKRINIVFLSEGYTLPEIGQYNQNVQTALNDLFTSSPYKEYQSYFNVFSIEVPSDESGADHPGTASDEPVGLAVFTNDTYFNGTFDFAGIHRLLVPEYAIANTVLQDNFPEWDISLMIVNHPWYGGSGGVPATFSLAPSSSEIGFHELGHSFADLTDEYETGGRAGFEAPNATAQTIRDSITWNIWLQASTPIPTPEDAMYQDLVGLFEGAVYNPTGWFRPKLNCKMRALGVPFCEVCKEQIILSIYNLIDIIELFQPTITSITLSDTSVMDFVVEKLQPDPNTVKSEWYLDGQLTDIPSDIFRFDAAMFTTDSHELKVIVTDTSAMVRNDPDNLRINSVIWSIEINRAPVAVNDHDTHWPEGYSLFQNYPNPFNPSTTIKFALPNAADVTIKIYNLLGKEVRTLLNQFHLAGVHSVVWDALDHSGQKVPSGVYLYKIMTENFVDAKKLLLIK